MKFGNTLRKRILLSFFALIILLGLSTALLEYYVVEDIIIARTQEQIKNNLKSARFFLNEELEKIARDFKLIYTIKDLEKYREIMGLDYLFVLRCDTIAEIRNSIIKWADEGKSTGGFRLMDKVELVSISKKLYKRAVTKIVQTPRARPSNLQTLEKAMVLEYAKPLYDAEQNVHYIIYGGKIINRDFKLIEKIHNNVFVNELYETKPVGTVTFFLDDIRIATNVLNQQNRPAIGTRVSEVVYKHVVEQGKIWIDRAFVVTDWYLTGYEPIRDVDNKIIGMLYVGTLEKPFKDMENRILSVLFLIIFIASLLCLILSVVLASQISRPVHSLLTSFEKVSGGELEFKTEVYSTIKELERLSASFNLMTEKLSERDKKLTESNEKLAALNKSYLDLIGFVSHELKSDLSSIVLNAYSLRDGFLGVINIRQKKAIGSITRNLDYLSATVRNFLNLSRIEKSELAPQKTDLLINEDIINPAIEEFAKPAAEKNMLFENRIDNSMRIKGDPDLLRIVANNLISNAVKFGNSNGRIIIDSQKVENSIEIEIYNDGIPIQESEKDKLFKKFSRLRNQCTQKAKGTGLGLYIISEIVKSHGGYVRMEPHENGNSFIFSIKTED